MKEITFTLTFFILTTVMASAQRGGGDYNNSYGHANSTPQFTSMATLNRGNNVDGNLRPNSNRGNNSPNTNHHAGHHYNNDHGHQHHGTGNNAHCGDHTTGINGQHHYIHAPVQSDLFHHWLHELSYERNSAVRLDVALSYVNNHWLTTHQIHDILNLFSNESVMLMLAEEAYPNACDPYNYHELYSCFSNSACVLHLQNFLIGH
ncbi:DUF4476 domain-containing protein [Aureispira anguillae]|uniref:DUF4476 domain-containing protein n=1 Tax=Aureispira anguillae TaxID=2864201 RepID=A0A915VKI1_9BACT|nr:DUF4476 domain-containing protein [Aureispira anguillae]BDS09703.1 DUF4476 domain-containing protein [Aureispira anguillae]